MIQANDKRILINNTIALMIVQIFSYLSPILILPYISRVLGLEGYGIIAISLSIISISQIVIEFGFDFSGPYYVVKNKNNVDLVNKYLGAVIFIKIVMCLIMQFGIIIYFNISTLFINGDKIALLLCVIIFIQIFNMPWFFQGIEKMRIVTTYTIITRLVYLVSVFVFVKESGDVLQVLICYLISQFFSAVFNIFYIHRQGYNVKKPNKDLLVYVLKNSFQFFISRIFVSVYTTASTFILGNLTGITHAGIYSSAEKLYQGGQSLTRPVSQAIYPYLARTGNKSFVRKYVSFLLVPLTVVCTILFIFAERVIGIFYGIGFIQAVPIFRVFMIVSIINFVAVNYGYPAFASIKRVDIANKSVILGGCVQLTLIIILVATKSVSGFLIAVSVLFSETFVMIFRLLMFRILKKSTIN